MTCISNRLLICVLMPATFAAACAGPPEASAGPPEATTGSPAPSAEGLAPSGEDAPSGADSVDLSAESQELHGLDLGVSRVLGGFRISPVPLDLRRKSRVLVGLGSYLVNAAGGCNDCHTQPPFAAGGDPFQGQPTRVNAERYLAGGRQFGPITSANLTPDADGRPGGLTFAEFKSAIRTGRDPDEPGRILQVMPWPVYANLSDMDLRAIYEFLRAIPSRPTSPAPAP